MTIHDFIPVTCKSFGELWWIFIHSGYLYSNPSRNLLRGENYYIYNFIILPI